ncbi:MAG: hypothetical protein HKL84_10970 [Acidimicrobiaceae bacterium]|nr:hypothetical protein [Acidimicrobiaceae bacterium]
MIHFVNVVWGEEFTRLFLDAALPNSMSPGNLGAFVDDEDCIYRLYTTPTDASVVRNADGFKLLTRLVSTEVIEFTGLDEGDRYEQLIRCHRDALLRAHADDAAVIFLAPDALLSDGSLGRLRELIADDIPVVAIPGPRVTIETFLSDFLRDYMDAESQSASIASRELVGLAHEHLHDSAKSLFWDAEKFAVWPANIYWRMPESGEFLIRAFHMHPLMIRRIPDDFVIDGVIDGAFIASVCPDPDDIYVVTDSDEIALVEMTSSDGITVIEPLGPASEIAVAEWAVHATNTHHRSFVNRPIYFHSSELSPEWDRVAEESHSVISRVHSAYPRALVSVGISRVHAGRFDDALEYCTKAIELVDDPALHASAAAVIDVIGKLKSVVTIEPV